MQSHKSSLIVVSGFPAAGKDTVADALVRRLSIEKIITHTTRAPRKNEVDGIHYHFVSEKQFHAMVAKGQFIEHLKHGSSWKGTHKSYFNDILKNKKRCLWRVDPSRAATTEELFIEKFGIQKGLMLTKSTLTLFIDVRNHEELRKRWLGRDKESSLAEFERRYKQDLDVYNKYKHRFNHIVYNDTDLKSVINKTLEKI